MLSTRSFRFHSVRQWPSSSSAAISAVAISLVCSIVVIPFGVASCSSLSGSSSCYFCCCFVGVLHHRGSIRRCLLLVVVPFGVSIWSAIVGNRRQLKKKMQWAIIACCRRLLPAFSYCCLSHQLPLSCISSLYGCLLLQSLSFGVGCNLCSSALAVVVFAFGINPLLLDLLNPLLLDLLSSNGLLSSLVKWIIVGSAVSMSMYA